MREIRLTYPHQLFRLWKQGHVHRVWSCQYPELFDASDISNASNQYRYGFHFGEWLTAVHFWNKGYHVLQAPYFRSTQAKHRRKSDLAAALLSKPGLALLARNRGGHPDLLVFDPEHRFFFFAEVKRERDRLSNDQRRFFSVMEQELGCQVLVVSLQAKRQ